ncbi:MAG: hypothetical protein K1X53_00560 [Candidatus Sumerlaeaceae bacterium]|nr:hypothetical protein [Candidatus Sumerlaeaceae bacterium]
MAAWKTNLKPYIPSGSRKFSGYYVDGDIPAGIFSYSIPAEMTSESLFMFLEGADKWTTHSRITANEWRFVANQRNPMTFDDLFVIWISPINSVVLVNSLVDSPNEYLALPELYDEARKVATKLAGGEGDGVSEPE